MADEASPCTHTLTLPRASTVLRDPGDANLIVKLLSFDSPNATVTHQQCAVARWHAPADTNC